MVSCLVVQGDEQVCSVDLARVPAVGEWLNIDGDFYRVESVVWQISFCGGSEYSAVLNVEFVP
jgi:hypothetical protein